MGRNQSLGHFIGKLDKRCFIIYHSKFSNNADIPILAFKAFSRVFGFHPISQGAEKIILVSKNYAMRCLGYHPKISGTRAGYFACMTSYLLAGMEKPDAKLLTGYRKQEYLKFRGDVQWNKKDKETETKDVP